MNTTHTLIPVRSIKDMIVAKDGFNPKSKHWVQALRPNLDGVNGTLCYVFSAESNKCHLAVLEKDGFWHQYLRPDLYVAGVKGFIALTTI
jgi:hypothetical protein